jgi:hypothetical protein
MVATFPLPLSSISNGLKIVSGLWMPRRFDEVSGLGSSELLTSQLAPPVWYSTVEAAPMQMDEFRRLRSKLMLLDGAMNTFLFASPEAMYPQSDQNGTVLGANTVQVHTVGGDGKTLRLKGLPAGYDITAGDFFSIAYGGGRVGLYLASEDATADGSGITPTFECRFHLRPGTAVNDIVSLAPPVAKVKIMPGSLTWSGSGQFVTVGFEVQQTLVA